MSILKKNILGNFAGNIWVSVISFVFIPLYVKFLGIEAYGVMGVFATLQVIFNLLDMGLSHTMNREMARLSSQPGKEQEMCNLVRTLELIYWGIGVLIGILVVLSAPVLTHHWLRAGKLAPETIQQTIRLMGITMAFQWPISLYSGGLLGLQKQVLLSVLNSVAVTIRNVGAIFVLWRLSPTIQAFFEWQIFAYAFHTLLVAFFLRRHLPLTAIKACFCPKLLSGIWRFAAGISLNSIAGLGLTQMDKIVLSRMLTLEQFGFYTLASGVALSLSNLVTPIFSALYPRFTQLIASGKAEELKQVYHLGSQAVSVIILPVGLVMAFFSREILSLWIRNPSIVGQTHSIMSILVIGTILNAFYHVPAALQLAYGWTKLSVMINFVSLSVLLPLMLVLTHYFGAPGAAVIWVALNLGYVLIGVPLMHRRILPHERNQWYWSDAIKPLATALLCVGLCRWMFYSGANQPLIIGNLAGIVLLAFISAVLSSTKIRKAVVDYGFV